MAFLPIRTVALPAATSTLLTTSQGSRQTFKVVNIGTNPATMSFDSAAVAGEGWPLAPADEAGGQGGGIDFENAPANSVYAISTLGTTLCVMEG